MELEINKLLNVLKLSAQIIIENGGETYRAEETIKYICKSLNVREAEPIATPTGLYFTISIDGEENSTVVKRIRKRTINLQKISEVNNISRELTSGQITLNEALLQLEYIYGNDKTQYKYSVLFGGISSAFFALMFGGGLFEFTVALFSGIMISIISKNFEELQSYQFFSSIIAGSFLSFAAIASTHVFGMGNYNHIIVGGIMPLLPGLAMTNAIRDTIRGDLLSGIARATEALLVASSLAAGAGAVIYAAYALGIS